jgi:hypothetical protein
MSSVSINQSTKASQRANQVKPNRTEPNQTKQAKKAQMKPGYQIQTLCARVPQTPQSRGKEKTREKKKKKG